jgi:hypothetical protein
VRGRGWRLHREGNRYRCLCPLHEEKTPSFVISNDLFRCFGCNKAGSVIDLHAALRNISIGEAMRELSGELHEEINGACNGQDYYDPFFQNVPVPRETPPSPKEVAAYGYQNATGQLVFEVVRFTPKTFRQAKVVAGKRVWNMDGVERLPYRLPDLLARPPAIWVTEGEKDCETLRAIGQVATCNPGGAGKWLPAFSQYLKGQCVYLCPDRDDPGQKHMREVLRSLEGLCEWAKWITLPPEFKGAEIKDISDLRQACETSSEFVDTLLFLQKQAPLIERGVESQSLTMGELESHYMGENLRFTEVSLSLARWVPSFKMRALGPGDVLGIMAGTGQLKTAVAQNILAANDQLPSLFFQLELSSALMFERCAAISTGIPADEIQRLYEQGLYVDWKATNKFKKMLINTASVSMADVDSEIARASAKMGVLPKVFVIDYVQLVRGPGSRYERVSNACEEVKRLAKKWNVIAILISQIGRKKTEWGDDGEDEVKEVHLFDAKESGSFENSCSLVLGLWKTSPTQMRVRVLKQTKGTAGQQVDLNLRGSTFIIEA